MVLCPGGVPAGGKVISRWRAKQDLSRTLLAEGSPKPPLVVDWAAQMTALFRILAILFLATPAAADKLDDIAARGALLVGVTETSPPFSYRDPAKGLRCFHRRSTATVSSS